MGIRDKQPPDYTAMTEAELYAEFERISGQFQKVMARVHKRQKRVAELHAEIDKLLDETTQLNDQQSVIGAVLERREFDSLIAGDGKVH